MFKALKIIYCLFLLNLSLSALAQINRSDNFKERYTLKQVVVLSRHNIRSPLSGRQSTLQRITPHEWYHWSSAPSELSLRGGALETIMGQYFRKWLVNEGLMKEVTGIKDIFSIIIDITDKSNSLIASSPTPLMSSTSSVADELAKLAKLKDAGILSEEEFNAQKSKLLNL